jgi:hypothetical protein
MATVKVDHTWVVRFTVELDHDARNMPNREALGEEAWSVICNDIRDTPRIEIDWVSQCDDVTIDYELDYGERAEEEWYELGDMLSDLERERRADGLNT